jgi:hypothetical protein
MCVGAESFPFEIGDRMTAINRDFRVFLTCSRDHNDVERSIKSRMISESRQLNEISIFWTR